MPPRWYVAAVRELEARLDDDHITKTEFDEAMRELGRELDEEESRHRDDF